MMMEWPPRIQVAGVSSLEEALFCATVGVDAVGFTLDIPSGIHDGLTRQRARRIIEKLPAGLNAVIITYLHEAAHLHGLLEDVGGDAVQLHGTISKEELTAFRRLHPSVKTIGRITVRDERSIEEATRMSADLYDALILDSWDPRSGRIGATGLVHDWSISAEIVRRSSVPIILAGGLNPNNVSEAVIKVSPKGVDAHTGIENPDGTRNFEKIRMFAKSALDAFGTIERRSSQPIGALDDSSKR
jgi:phosphoribosylanthranilate isomerase